MFNTQLSTNPIFAFIIGVLSTFPSLTPTALNLLNRPSIDLYKRANLESKLITIPIYYGILHIVLFFLINTFLPISFRNYWTLGFIVGIIYPTLGTVTGYARDVYGTTSTLILYIKGIAMYLFIYGIIFNWIAGQLCK